MASKRSAPDTQESDGVPRSTTEEESAQPNAKRQKTSSLMASAQQASTLQDGDTSYRCAPVTTTTSTHLTGYGGRAGGRGVTPFCSSAPNGGVSGTPWQEASANHPETTSRTTPPAVPDFSLSKPPAPHYTRTAEVKQEGSCPPTAGSFHARSSEARLSSPAPPSPPPKVDRHWIEQRLKGEQETTGISLETFLGKSRRKSAAEVQKGDAARDQQHELRAEGEVESLKQTETRKNMTRKPTPPDQYGKPLAHLSNLDDVQELIRILKGCQAGLNTNLQKGRFRHGKEDQEYIRAAGRYRWKRNILEKQAAILEWLEHADRQPHSTKHTDLIEFDLTDAIPFDESHFCPGVQRTRRIPAAKWYEIREALGIPTPGGIEEAIVWACRQIKDLEQSPLHYRPAPKDAESVPGKKPPQPERSHFLKDMYGFLQSLVEEQYNSKERRKRVEALAAPVRPRAKRQMGTPAKVVTESVCSEREEMEYLLENLLKEAIAAAARTQADARSRLGPSPVRAWHKERDARLASLSPAAAATALKAARREFRKSLVPLAKEMRENRAAPGLSHNGLTAKHGTNSSLPQPVIECQAGIAAGDLIKPPSTPVRTDPDTSADSYSPRSPDSAILDGKRSPVNSPGWSPRSPSDDEGEW